jgi:hypothetical protein
MKRLLVLCLLALAPGCFTDEDKSRDALVKSGYTDIQVGGYAWWTCGDDYTYETKFTAKNPQGMVVSGAVCCGILKGCSVKF